MLEDLAIMMTAAADVALHDHEVIQLRKSLAGEYPHLTVMRMPTFRVFEQKLVDIVTRRLAEDSPSFADDPARLESRAHLVAMVSLAAMHHAWTQWGADPEGAETIVDRLTSSFAELTEVIVELAPR